ncbi:MAG TPA: phospholipase D-like domain-containing protein [Gammaproteobacteria bacterium]|jgi:cardiolipin synthase|nr:phospholipase D-like domain-containing protein [Gammaproteobacteria bacterium]
MQKVTDNTREPAGIQPKGEILDFDCFIEGDSAYGAMLKAIAGAREAIRLEAYIFADDEIGWQFANALAEQAGRGVSVCVHIDAAGSLFWLSRRLPRYLREHGVRIQWYHRVGRSPIRYNRRNHRKMLIVDDSVAFLGGMNLHRENSLRLFGLERWRDTHFAIRGPLVRQAIDLFDALWRHRREPPCAAVGLEDTALITNRPRRWRHLLRRLYGAAFASASSKIYLTTPYLVPDLRTQRGMMAAARRGVDVRLLVPRQSDSRLALWAAHAAYESLLSRGVRLYEYLPRVLHAKTAVVDGTWSSVGTANLDYRSFFLNYELNLVTADKRMASVLEEQFLKDLEDAEEVKLKRWMRRGLPNRVGEFIGWLGRRWL